MLMGRVLPRQVWRRRAKPPSILDENLLVVEMPWGMASEQFVSMALDGISLAATAQPRSISSAATLALLTRSIATTTLSSATFASASDATS